MSAPDDRKVPTDSRSEETTESRDFLREIVYQDVKSGKHVLMTGPTVRIFRTCYLRARCARMYTIARVMACV